MNEVETPRHNQIDQNQKKSIVTRTISALVLVAIALPCIFLGDWFVFALALALAVFASYEMSKCVQPTHKWLVTCIALVIELLIMAWPIFSEMINNYAEVYNSSFRIYIPFEGLSLSAIVLVVGLLFLVLTSLCDKTFTFKSALFLFAYLLLIGLGLQCALYVRYIPQITSPGDSGDYFNLYDSLGSSIFMIYVILATYLTDAGAFFIGMLFGKHKLAPKISPKKTVEGFIGGVVISFVISFAFGMIMAAVDYPLLSIFDLSHWYLILVLSILIPIFATLGDLLFSFAKRTYGIKDFGNTIPGHGGVLDRTDSLIVTMIISAIFVVICYSAGTGSIINLVM
ncbi:MAG: phosphatidate cytidylyltransferase [Coprobacillus sp.]|nr:phosphatidate cytidylyltransferase [Coprobacillus sp.]